MKQFCDDGFPLLQDQIVLAGVAGWADFAAYPHIHKIVRSIEETPRFASYLQSRPAASF